MAIPYDGLIVVDKTGKPSAEFDSVAAPSPPQRDVTLKIDADLLEWLAARGEDAAEEVNGLLRFYMDTTEAKALEFAADAHEPGELDRPSAEMAPAL